MHWPIDPTTLILPWAVLEHDNHRLMPTKVKGPRGTMVARLIAAPKYREAKEATRLLAMGAFRGPLITVPCEVRGVAYFPDARKRDAGNYRKLITDALTGIAYLDDALLHREVWERGPIDRENPRIEVTVTPLAA